MSSQKIEYDRNYKQKYKNFKASLKPKVITYICDYYIMCVLCVCVCVVCVCVCVCSVCVCVYVCVCV